MDIVIVGRHTRVSDEMRERIIARMEKLQTLAPRATRVEVHVVHERNRKMPTQAERVEITLYGRTVVRAEAAADDRLVALEQAAIRVADQVRKLHERRAKRHKGKPGLHAVARAEGADVPAGEGLADEPIALDAESAAASDAEDSPESVVPWDGAPESTVREIPLDGTPIMIRSKTHQAAPMSVPDAIDQMELVGHDFFLFVDVETGLPSAVYRRRGWTYGVIHLEQAQPQDEAERETA